MTDRTTEDRRIQVTAAVSDVIAVPYYGNIETLYRRQAAQAIAEKIFDHLTVVEERDDKLGVTFRHYFIDLAVPVVPLLD